MVKRIGACCLAAGLTWLLAGNNSEAHHDHGRFLLGAIYPAVSPDESRWSSLIKARFGGFRAKAER